jgi:hypothetical protein
LKISTDLNKLHKLVTKTLFNKDEPIVVEEWNPQSSMIEMFGSMMCPNELNQVIKLI